MQKPAAPWLTDIKTEPATVTDEYIFRRQMASGGGGEVHEVEDVEDGSQYVCKTISKTRYQGHSVSVRRQYRDHVVRVSEHSCWRIQVGNGIP